MCVFRACGVPALLGVAAVPNRHYIGHALISAGLALLRAPPVCRDFTGTIPGTWHYSTGTKRVPRLYRVPGTGFSEALAAEQSEPLGFSVFILLCCRSMNTAAVLFIVLLEVRGLSATPTWYMSRVFLPQHTSSMAISQAPNAGTRHRYCCTTATAVYLVHDF